MEINIQNASHSMPFSRNDLLTDILHNRAYGDISNVWQILGHILITTNEGRKLFTFDCKPVHQQHAFDNKSLDIPVLVNPLIDVKMLSSSVIILVDASGHVMFWKFTQAFSWSHVGDVQICTSSGADVISVAYIPECNTIFWCERQHLESPSASSVYCICKQQLSPDLDPQKIRVQSQSSVFIQNCPPADVHAMSNNVLLITTRFDSEQVTVHMAYDCTKNHLSLFVGDECMHYPVISSSKAVDFHEVVMMCLPTVMQTQPGQGDLGMRSDISMGQAVMLSSSGLLVMFACIPDSGNIKISKKTITLSSESDATYKAQTKHWFLHRGHLGIVKNNTVHIFRVNDGSHVCTSTQDSFINVQNVFCSTSPVFLAWVLTSENLFALQGVETKHKEMYTTVDKLPDDNLLQTHTLRLAHLQELRVSEYNQAFVQELEELKDKLSDMRNLAHHSQLSGIVAPYLEEYWRLESLSKALLDSEKQQPVIKANARSSEDMVKTLMESRSLSKVAHHAKLLWLSEVHPQELLKYLCQGITIDSELVLPSEMKKWQSLLGMEGGDLMNFEFVCRLLFRLMPAKLLNFVKCAESVSEQAVGVSAFVRKKQSLIYYKTAWECLPHSQTSCDPKTAASIKAKLIIASESENCIENALKYLLQHGLWSEAVDVVKGQSGNEESLPSYLHITIKSLAENQVLSDYATDLFTVMPSWKSFLTFSQLATERPEIRQQQLSTSAKDIFFQGGLDVRLGDVKPFLHDLIKKMNS